MKIRKISFFVSLYLAHSLYANDFKEAEITVQTADKVVELKKGKYINEHELKNEKIKTLNNKVQVNQRDISNLASQKDKELNSLNNQKRKEVNDMNILKNAEIEAITRRYEEDMRKLDKEYKDKEIATINSFKETTQKKGEEIELIKTEIVGLEKIEKVVEVAQNTEPTTLTDLNAVTKYIERNNHLDRVMLKLGIIDSVKLYSHILKKGYSFGIKKRSLDYALKLAESTEGIDYEYFEVTLKNEKIEDIEAMVIDIREFITKNNNILLEK